MTEVEAVPMLLIVAGAFFMPILSSIIGIPAAVTEIIYGMVIGVGGLHLVGSHEFLSFIAQFGFAYLMFLAGMEMDFPFIERQGFGGILRGGTVVAGIILLGSLLTLLMGLSLFYVLVMSAMSIGILVALLQEWGLGKNPLGQDLLLVGSIGEFSTISLLTFFHIFVQKGLGWSFFLEGGKLLFVLLVAFFFLKILQLAVWWFPERFHRLVQEKDPSELGVRAGFLVMMGFVAISALLHIEFVLGAFIAGAVFSYVFRQRGALEIKLASAGYGFFIPIFFIHVGVNFDPSSLLGQDTALLVLLLTAGILVSKIPVSVLAAMKKKPLQEVFASPFLLATPLTLLIAIEAIGRELEVVGKEEGNAVVLVALLSGLVFPVIGKLILGPGRTKGAG